MRQRTTRRRPIRPPACPRRITGLDHDRYSEAPAQTVLVAGVDYIGAPLGSRGGAR